MKMNKNVYCAQFSNYIRFNNIFPFIINRKRNMNSIDLNRQFNNISFYKLYI